MGLKARYRSRNFKHLNIKVEIRPRWDWKFIAVFVAVDNCVPLKSDQDGIESHQDSEKQSCWSLRLKSDQDGIESMTQQIIYCLVRFYCWNQTKMGLKVEVRFADTPYDARWNQTKMGLKDSLILGGKLRSDCVEIRPRWDWKSTYQFQFSFYHLRRVEIRPRWDWKLVNSILSSPSHDYRWNQTKMGLKGFNNALRTLPHPQFRWNQTKMGLKVRGIA